MASKTTGSQGNGTGPPRSLTDPMLGEALKGSHDAVGAMNASLRRPGAKLGRTAPRLAEGGTPPLIRRDSSERRQLVLFGAFRSQRTALCLAGDLHLKSSAVSGRRSAEGSTVFVDRYAYHDHLPYWAFPPSTWRRVYRLASLFRD